MRRKLIYCLLILNFIIFSCGKNKSQIDQKVEKKVTDFYNFKHLIDTTYSYNIRITEINTENKTNAFEFENEKYSVPVKVDGTTVTISYQITNPYSKTMRVPFPEYYTIYSEEFTKMDGYVYDKYIHSYISNQTEITNSVGKPLSSFSNWDNDPISRNLIVEFKPNETIKINVKFTNPFPASIKKITFIGFKKHIKKMDNDFLEMDDEEKEIYLADKNIQYGLVLDLTNKKVTGLINISQ